MPRKPTPQTQPSKIRKRKADDPAQYERFREFAREHETDDDPDEFDRKFRKTVSRE